jgi:hypothetical protein
LTSARIQGLLDYLHSRAAIETVTRDLRPSGAAGHKAAAVVGVFNNSEIDHEQQQPFVAAARSGVSSCGKD